MSKSMRTVFAALAASSAVHAFAQQSLHEQPIGTVVERSFVLAGKVVPLPEGKFKVVHAGLRDSRLLPGARIQAMNDEMAEVILYRSDAGTLQAVVHAQANTGSAARWAMEPCKRDDLLFKQDLGQRRGSVQDCATVTHQIGFLTNPRGPWVDVFHHLKADGVAIPLQLALHVTFMRVFLTQFVTVNYYINPVYYGHAPDRGQNWIASPWHKSRIDSDAEKAAFVKSIADWSVKMQPLVNEGFEGKDPFAKGGSPLSLEFFRGTKKAAARE